MKFDAMCTASVSKNGTHTVLLKFAPPFEAGHLLGDIPKELGARAHYHPPRWEVFDVPGYFKT